MSPDPRKAMLRIEGLSKSYGSLKAVDRLTFAVREGEILGFLGPNGAGKTTTISMICGLLKPDEGEIRFNGEAAPPARGDSRPLLGLCPQNIIVWESLTCREQLEFMGRLYGISFRAARKKALELLERLGLSEKGNKQAKTLSGGMKRRLNIALALVHEPRLLILDEPQAGLDPQSRVLVRDFVRSLTGTTTVILTTHEMDEADRLSDRVAIIDHGRLLELDEPRNLKNRIGEGDVMEITVGDGLEEPLHDLPPSVRALDFRRGTLRLVGTQMADVLPVLMARLKERQIRIEDIAIRKKTLEDVFISLTGRRLRE